MVDAELLPSKPHLKSIQFVVLIQNVFDQLMDSGKVVLLFNCEIIYRFGQKQRW